MMKQELLAAVCEYKQWTQRFTRRDYPDAFQEYVQQYGLLFAQALQEAASPDALANDFLDGLEIGWKNQRFWNRSAVQAAEKRMVVIYLTPMLLSMDETRCPEFARHLQVVWFQRRPTDAYELADFQKLYDGFSNSILGIDLSGRQFGRDRNK